MVVIVCHGWGRVYWRVVIEGVVGPICLTHFLVVLLGGCVQGVLSLEVVVALRGVFTAAILVVWVTPTTDASRILLSQVWLLT